MKPQNILLGRHMETCLHVQLCDFGLAEKFEVKRIIAPGDEEDVVLPPQLGKSLGSAKRRRVEGGGPAMVGGRSVSSSEDDEDGSASPSKFSASGLGVEPPAPSQLDPDLAKKLGHFRGTAAYAAMRALKRRPATPRDDLEGAFWVILDLLLGGVNWRIEEWRNQTSRDDDGKHSFFLTAKKKAFDQISSIWKQAEVG